MEAMYLNKHLESIWQQIKLLSQRVQDLEDKPLQKVYLEGERAAMTDKLFESEKEMRRIRNEHHELQAKYLELLSVVKQLKEFS